MEQEESPAVVNIDDTPPDQSWRGCSMSDIYRNLNEFELQHVPPVRPSAEHTVLHHYPIRAPDNEPPRPLKSHPKWDAQHVRLPCSPKSQYPVTAPDGSSSIESRWEMIEQALLQPITNSHELQAAILSYNTKYAEQWQFRGLHRLFEDDLDDSETQVFFEDLLPRIVRLALRLPELVQAPIPLLKQGQTHSVTLTQQQVSSLLANAFLCTFPRRNTLKRKSEYSTFPDINFNRLFQSSGPSVVEKIKCICHYFRRVCPTERDSSNVPNGVVTFTRHSLHYTDMPNWTECLAPLGATLLHITSEGTIEDQGLGLLQVDFANKFLGGGVLGSGCVQEEIRFVICPELLISKLFTECLRPTEAVLMVGCERYSNYKGYAGTFQWAGNHEDATPLDCSRRRQTHIVAIDALAFVKSSDQYREELMLRELNKAYVGFLHTLDTPPPGVASGNWGCGAFGGEATLKALLQLMVCSVTKRPLVYYTFGNAELRDEVYHMHSFLSEHKVCVKQLWATLRQFQAQRLAHKELYNFIYSFYRKEDTKCSLNLKKLRNKLKNSMATKTSQSLGSSHKSSVATCSNSIRDVERKQSTHANAKNVSKDVFATDSEEDETEVVKADISPEKAISVASSISNSQASTSSMTPLAFTDDSETDAILLAAADKATSERDKKPQNKNSNDNDKEKQQTASPQTPTAKSRNELRQRTLLEMLDQCYTEDSPAAPASKRHCFDNRNAGADKKPTK